MSGKWEASTTGIVVQILCRNTSHFLPSISIPASTAFTPTGDLSVGEREVEEAKRKGLVVAVVGSVKDKAPELLVAEGLVKHAVLTANYFSTNFCIGCVCFFKSFQCTGEAGSGKSGDPSWRHRGVQRDIKPCPAQCMSITVELW